MTGDGDRAPPSPLPPLLLIGCGRMGGALLDGWVSNGLADSVVVDPSGPAVPAPHRVVAHPDAVPPGFDPGCVVLAVKPQLAEAAAAGIGDRYPDALVLSIMAGRTLSGVRALTGARFVVRAMPNTPAAIGLGITGAFADDAVDPTRRALAQRLLETVGEVAWLAREDLLDAVTAVSGSGPAYVFLLAECLEAAALQQGLPPDIARRLARRTVAGAGALLEADPSDARAMREAVTSRAGTTERALAVLMGDGGLPELVSRAVQAAADRSRALAS